MMKNIIDRIKGMSKKNKIILLTILVFLLVGNSIILLYFFSNNKTSENNEAQYEETSEVNNGVSEGDTSNIDYFVYDPYLPKPQVTTGARGELGIDNNINESNIDFYLGRSDSVYRDMRMLEDPANYENIQGNSTLNGYINGFEVVPLPYIIPVKGLPKEVGNSYTGTTLFHLENGVYVPNYEESMSIIEKLFPKNKYIFLMCGGGGYAGMMKNFLVSMGWHEDRIYNVGGFWYYNGYNRIDTPMDFYKYNAFNYNFDSVPYHNIEFDKLTKTSNYVIPDYGVERLEVVTEYVKVEKGMSFQLNVIALPNEAKNKKLIYTSYNESIVTVDENGLIKGINSGYVTVEVKSDDDPNKKDYISVLVTNNRDQFGKVNLSDVSEELEIFNNNDITKLESEWNNLLSDIWNNSSYSDDQKSEEYDKLYKQYITKIGGYRDVRINTFNKMMAEKKTFIVLINSKDCGDDFRIIDSAEKILKENNIPYFYTSDPNSGYDYSFYDSNIDDKDLNSGVVVVVKEGKIYSVLRRDYDAIKSDEETKTWLSKFVDLN